MSVIIVLIHELVINKEIESENIVASVKIIFDASFASISMVTLKITSPHKSCYLVYNRVDTYDDNQQESCHGKYSWLRKNHI